MLVQFTTFNPSESLFTISLLAFEFLEVGVVETYHDIKSCQLCQLYHFIHAREVYKLMCEICYVLLTLIYIKRVVMRCMSRRKGVKGYFRSIWTYVEWGITILTFSVVVVFVFRVLAINQTVYTTKKFRKRYVSFEDAAFYETTVTCILAATITTFVF